MADVSIICCYNNLNEFSRLCECIRKQNIEIDVIGIDNTKSKYSSCARAFNDNLKNVRTQYVIFTHQDIVLKNDDMISIFYEALKSIDKYDILGIAGRRSSDGNVVTNMVHGDNQRYAGKCRVEYLEECDSLDECFFGGSTECFIKYPFDEILCDNWHLYAVEACLAARSRGNKAQVCGIPVIHKSAGKMNQIYNLQFYRLSKKYSGKFDRILTTCASASTRFPLREVAFIKRAISIFLGRYD